MFNEKINPIFKIKSSTSKKELERWLEFNDIILKICKEYDNNIAFFYTIFEEKKSIKMIM